jgi:hypothetical protein
MMELDSENRAGLRVKLGILVPRERIYRELRCATSEKEKVWTKTREPTMANLCDLVKG